MSSFIFDYAKVFDAIPIPATLIDAQGIIVDVNPSLLAHAGEFGSEIRKEDRVGQHILRFASTEEERGRFGGFIDKILNTGKAQHIEWLFIDQSGQRLWFDIRAEVLKDATGTVTGALIIREDITERKQAEEALQESEERYRLLFEHMVNGFAYHKIILDDNGQPVDYLFLEVNAAFEKLTGLKRDDVMGKTVTEVLPGIDKVDFDWINAYGRVALTGEGVSFEAFSKLLNRWCTVTAHSPQKGRFAAIFDDITKRKQMEQELIRLERFRALGELVSGISHNLNNILTGALLPAQLVQMSVDGPEILESVNMVVSSIEQARSVIKRLNESIRGQEWEKPCSVSVDEVVREVVKITRPRWKDEAEAKGVPIEVVTEFGDLPPVKATPTGLHDVLRNLLLNAIEAMPEGGRISIYAQENRTGVQLSIADTGIGMDEETCRRALEPFFTTKQTVDTGLGLSTASGIVAGWGGAIQVESTLGQGTTVTVNLPIWQDAPTEEAEVRERHRKLLIVEDDERTNSILSRLLSKEFEVEVRVNGRNALERFVPGQYDVILMDLGLPDVPGDRVTMEMRKRDPAVSIILITGWVLEEDDPRLQVFDFHVQKPLRLEEITDTISQAIELHDVRAGRQA